MLKMPEVSPRGEPTSTVASPEVLEGVEMVTEPSKVVEPDIANALGMAAGVPLQMPAADEKNSARAWTRRTGDDWRSG